MYNNIIYVHNKITSVNKKIQKLKKLKTKAEKPKLLQVIRHIRYAILNFEEHIRDSNDPKNSYNPERRNYMYFQTFWTKGNKLKY